MNLPTYRIEVSHPELKQHRVITGKDLLVVQSKAREQMRRWEDRWEKLQVAERKTRVKNEKLAREEQMAERALSMTDEARSKRDDIQNILKHTLSVNDEIDWNSLYDHREYLIPPPPCPNYVEFEPEPAEELFAPKLGLLDHIFLPAKKKKIANAKRDYEAAVAQWKRCVEDIGIKNNETYVKYQKTVEQVNRAREAFYEDRNKRNKAIECEAIAYFNRDPEAISDYCELVLSRSEYPSELQRGWDLSYVPETSILVVDYELPNVDAIPKLKEAKYVKARNEIVTCEIPESKINEIYDDVLYQIALRTIHELYEADAINALAMVVFNGYVSAIDRSTGNLTRTCVMSVQASKADFQAINLANVVPKDCFKRLKGVGSSKLHGLAPVPPILKIDKSDSRIVEAYSVIDDVDDSVNLASMDWEDFEHLIREVFASEFSNQGGEVHVTQASRDGGVDAIAFDPDPIRGGKIVIQAKRYTGSVDVSAVRDLYGTVMNEGAIKGILVTTSNYGPDAYKFAEGKPISLITGANLLHLLEKHGRRARIDLREAKQRLLEQRRFGQS